jgi:DNA polymerase/3'-5' exonuclease PolX
LAQDTENEEKRELPPDQKALKVFEGIFNVGERTADVWLKQYKKIPTASRPSPLAWVRANKGDMPTTRGGSKPMSHAQLIGLKYYKDLQKRIPRYYIDIVQMMIRVVLFKTFGKGSYKMAVAGSYRRGAEDSGDIDIIFTSDKFDLTQAVAALEKWGIVVATMSVDKSKFTGVCHCPSGQWHYFHLDIVYSTEKAWEAALLWFTGSKGFNTKTRNKARKLGYTLNQYGLFKEADKGRKHLIALTEKDILAKIGEPYVPPECR